MTSNKYFYDQILFWLFTILRHTFAILLDLRKIEEQYNRPRNNLEGLFMLER